MAKLKSHAKINLALDVLGKDGDYHLIDTVMCELPDLFDEIEIVEAEELKVEMQGVPQAENLAYKAAKMLGAKVHIKIKKNIPLAAGLGGGSSNAAAVLKALGGEHLADQLGMDVPFFVVGGVCRCTHYGEIVEKIETDLKFNPKIILGGSKTSTADAYSKLDPTRTGQNRNKTEKLISALRANDMDGVLANIHNDFEQLYSLQPGEHLSGSGPARFIVSTAQ